MKMVLIELQEKGYPNPWGSYVLHYRDRMNRRQKLDVTQRCVDRLQEIVGYGKWRVDIEGGTILLWAYIRAGGIEKG